MNRMTKIISSLAGLALAVTPPHACGGGNVSQADGPADPVVHPQPRLHLRWKALATVPYVDEQPVQPVEEPAELTPNFKQKYTYEDGVQFEFTKIERGKRIRATSSTSTTTGSRRATTG